MKRYNQMFTMSRSVGTVAVGMALLLIGCTPIVAPPAGDPNAETTVTTPAASTVAPADPSATDPSATQEPQAEETTMPATPAESTAPDVSSPVAQATADLAERLAVESAAIEVVEVRDVAWRDGSMGCPQPDMMYTQVIIEGMKIVLSVDGEEYHYHAGRNQEPFLCENPAEDGAVGS